MKCNYKKGQLNQFKILVSVINRTVDKGVLCNNAEYSFIVHTSTYDLHFTNSIISNFIFPRNTNSCSLHLHEKKSLLIQTCYTQLKTLATYFKNNEIGTNVNVILEASPSVIRILLIDLLPCQI